MGKSQRIKGQVGEREARDAMKRIGCIDTQRRVRNYEGDSDLIGAIPGVSFEVKLESRSNIGAAIRQAVEQAGNQIPAVLHRQCAKGERGNPWCLTIRVEDLPALLAAYGGMLSDARHQLGANAEQVIGIPPSHTVPADPVAALLGL